MLNFFLLLNSPDMYATGKSENVHTETKDEAEMNGNFQNTDPAASSSSSLAPGIFAH